MNTSSHQLKTREPGGRALFAFASRAAWTRLGAGVLSIFALSVVLPAQADEPATPVAEDSLLVATRDAAAAELPETPTETAEAADKSAADESIADESLEPTSELSEHVPELAGSEPTPASPETGTSEKPSTPSSQFGDALAKVAQPQKSNATAVTQASRRTARVARPTVDHEPVKFQGITAGSTTAKELMAEWGEPSDSDETAAGEILAYNIEPFESVEVLVDDNDVVATIKVTLASALESGKLAEQLALNQFEPVTVFDDNGQPLGQAFPERGVLFMFDASKSRSLKLKGTGPQLVSHVAIQPLDARAFTMRAENNLHGPFEQSINDLTTAIALDRNLADAHWLLSGIYLTAGQADSADDEAATACDLEPDNAAYQLRRGQTLALLGEYDEAVHTIRAILDRKDIEPIVRAQTLLEMARLASLGDVQIASKAIPFYTRAIEIGDREATSQDIKVRRAAKQLLIEAHLAVAEEIARQAFNQKVESLSQWVGRASGIAEEFIANDGGSVELRLLIAQRALAALSSFKPTLDPAPWVAEAEEAAAKLADQSDDELWQHRVKWELGIAYLNALRVEHSRRQTENALRYGQLAVENLAEGALSRQAVHSSEQLVAQLYFHMGAVYAVHKEDHLKAVQWYDKAAPLLTGPRPVSELYAPRREGEMLVSMGVTCWQLGQQARALELTRAGVNLVELAVENGILARNSLAVPYGNLATMYEQMGETTNAAKFNQLAKSITAPVAQSAATSAARPATRSNTAAMQGNTSATRGINRSSGSANSQRVRQAVSRR